MLRRVRIIAFMGALSRGGYNDDRNGRIPRSWGETNESDEPKRGLAQRIGCARSMVRKRLVSTAPGNATARMKPAELFRCCRGSRRSRNRQLEACRVWRASPFARSRCAAGLMALPDDLGVAAFGEPLAREREGRVPAPGVGANHLDAALEEIERRLAAHPTPGVDVARLPVTSRPRPILTTTIVEANTLSRRSATVVRT
jgi:hypothetical protein